MCGPPDWAGVAPQQRSAEYLLEKADQRLAIRANQVGVIEG